MWRLDDRYSDVMKRWGSVGLGRGGGGNFLGLSQDMANVKAAVQVRPLSKR